VSGKNLNKQNRKKNTKRERGDTQTRMRIDMKTNIKRSKSINQKLSTQKIKMNQKKKIMMI
jgi:hypothetical protein